MSAIAVVLFDLGNVLVSIHPERFAATLGLDEHHRTRHRARVIECIRRYESGEVGSDAFFSELSGVFGGTFTRERLRDALERVIGESVPGMPELLERVASSHAVALVSNTNETHFEYCRRAFPFIARVPRRFLSWKMGVMKPDPGYYRIVVEELGVPAESLVFIDDHPENVRAAEQAGMKGILFRGADQLKYDLHNLGI